MTVGPSGFGPMFPALALVDVKIFRELTGVGMSGIYMRVSVCEYAIEKAIGISIRSGVLRV